MKRETYNRKRIKKYIDYLDKKIDNDTKDYYKDGFGWLTPSYILLKTKKKI